MPASRGSRASRGSGATTKRRTDFRGALAAQRRAVGTREAQSSWSPNAGLAQWRAPSAICIGNVGATWLRRAGSRAAAFGARAHCRLTPTPVTAPARLLCSATGRAAGLKVGRQPPASRRTSGCEYPTVRAGAVFRRPQLQLASPVFSSPERATTHLSSSGPPARQRSPSRKAPMTPATFSGSSSRNRCPPPLTT
jgi:hypothetical protein